MANGNPPAPGQTVTNGTWGPPPETPPPPPQPAVGQNQLLRLKLGMGVKAFADGTPDVQPMGTPLGLPGIPLGHAPMGAPFPAYGDTAPTTGISIGGPGGISLPPSMLDSARAAAGGPPAQPGQSQWPTSMLQNARNAQVANRAAGQPTSAPNMPTLGPGLDAAIKAPPVTVQHPDGTIQGVNDPGIVAQKAAMAGSTHAAAAAMHEPESLTREQFISAMRGVPQSTVDKLWGMQHYLTPEQQMLPAYMGEMHKQMTDAASNLAEAQAAGSKVTADQLQTLRNEYNISRMNYMNVLKVGGLHSDSVLVPTQQQK